MNQPRQVPWTSLRELEQVYLAIYTSKDHEFVIHRLAAWKYSGSLPQALDATLALLVAMKTDLNSVPNQEFNSSPRVSGSGFAARQGYALAIIRFVNGIVDPLQVGVFARSIAAIATQVEMPLSLVELRHACTHEELPSLEALRDGAKLALSWLEQKYFRPTLAQTQNASQSIGDFDPSTTLEPILKQYKPVAKQVSKDASLRSALKNEFASLFRSVDIWIAETTVAIWKNWKAVEPIHLDTEARITALRVLAHALTQSGGLVPVARKKQPTSIAASTADLWAPLLGHLQQKHPEFGNLLCEALISSLTAQTPRREDTDVMDVADKNQQELLSPGYYLCLSGWLLWIESNWDEVPGCDPVSITIELLKNMPREAVPPHIVSVIEELKKIKPALGTLIDPLLTVVTQAKERPMSWTENSLEQMQQRLDSYQAGSRSDSITSKTNTNLNPNHTSQTISINGWKLLSEEDGWKPSPIGC